MKKLFVFIILFIGIVLPVQAKENKLYFTEKGNRLYYESRLIDENIFMKHTNMLPGDNYEDELIIENGTKTTYTLYFKIVPKDQSAKANELLENISMRITIDGKLVYNGKATGLDYTETGIDLQEAILLGDFAPAKKAKMLVETELSEEYVNNNSETSYIDWSFYAQYDDSKVPVEIVETPNTMKNGVPLITIISIIIIIIGLGVIRYGYKREN